MNLETETRTLLAYAVRQDQSLTSKISPMAKAIFDGGDLGAMQERLNHVFLAARGESLAAKTQGRREAAKALGRAWNRVVTGLRHHAQAQDLVLNFPNLASGDGETRVERSADASERRKAEKSDREAADAAALATFQEDQERAQLDTLRAMTEDELVAAIRSQVAAWSQGDRAAAARIYSALASKVAETA